MGFKQYREKRMQKDSEFRKIKEGYNLYFQVSHLITEARAYKSFSQEELADLVGTHQSSIARAESGASLPSLSFLDKIAHALGTYLVAPKFGFMVEDDLMKSSTTSTSIRCNLLTLNQFFDVPAQSATEVSSV